MALVLFSVFSGRVYNALYVAARLPSDLQGRSLLSADLLVPLSAVVATMLLVSQAVAGAAAVIAGHGALANTIRSLDEISQMTWPLATLPLGSLALAAGLAQRDARCGAQYVAWLGIAAGITLMITTSGMAFDYHWLHDGGIVGLLAFLFWISGSSGSFIRMERYS